jgi:hypothetical protein
VTQTVIDQATGTLPTSVGRCLSGIVIDSNEGSRSVSLDVSMYMQVRRAQPFDDIELSPDGDYDADGFLDLDDTCPLIPNPRQSPEVCTVVIDTSDPDRKGFPDNDGDTIADEGDNCVWTPNRKQLDTMGVVPNGGADFIGDACRDEFADVLLNGSSQLDFRCRSSEFVQAEQLINFVVLDFSESELDCDWDARTCEIVDITAVRVCGVDDVTSAAVGCQLLEGCEAI